MNKAAPSQELTDNDILVEVAGNPLASGQDAIDFARAVLAAAKRKAAPSQEPVGMVRWVKGRPVGELTNYYLRPDTPLYTTPPDAGAQIADLEHTVMKNCTELNAKDRQIAKLESERDDLNRRATEYSALNDQQAGRIAKLEAENKDLQGILQLTAVERDKFKEKIAAAEKDAARWKWFVTNWGEPHVETAIDAAMKLSPGDTAEGE